MRRFHVEVLHPTSLLSGDEDQRVAFESIWPRIGVTREHWTRPILIDSDGGLFIKGAQVKVVTHRQQWMRRWHMRREFQNLVALQRFQLEIPEPIAWGWETIWGLPLRSFLVLRAIDGVDFSEFIRGASAGIDGEPGPARLEVFRAVGEAVASLHAAGFIHGDLACRNLFLRRGRKPEVVLIDLARVERCQPNRLTWPRRKELYRLVKSADKLGAKPEEVDVMMQAFTGLDATSVITATRRLRAIEQRFPRKVLTWYWRVTGC